MTQFDLFTGAASDSPVFRVPPMIWRDAALESPTAYSISWVALWTEKSGWAVFSLGWMHGFRKACEVSIEFSRDDQGSLNARSVPDLSFSLCPFFGEIPLELLRVYWCNKSEFISEDEAIKSLNLGDNHD